MKYKKRKYVLLSVFFTMALFLSTACSSTEKNVSLDNSELQTIILDGTFVIDVDNPKETVGDADYVFLATVDEVVSTEQKHQETIETTFGTKAVSSPYTNFKVTVLKNIKGKLITDTPISLQKAGGVSADNTSLILYEDDSLPEVGKSYIFLAYAQDDGSLLVSGPNSNILVPNLDKDAKNNNVNDVSKTSDIISEYEFAYKNQKETNRDRSISVYDREN
ncbi:hypothetical protein HNQ35_002605 [Cerasibacillus quisquiliarum]|uniref:Cell surface protein n=1 Tax=Cerasibacillus quisquiliarum TaxID=227865 RepID=A0A511V0K7_9BACI|nr:hypothetical protein [Cerasibacillus quisquiliarum]MBB5147387.1 hypothetical protein [Cerasibacillus quisquiliarum]GEN32436.1 cell surface protein [Cerasibacillus quisquiliarum]